MQKENIAFTVETIAHMGVPQLRISDRRTVVECLLTAATLVRLSTPAQVEAAQKIALRT